TSIAGDDDQGGFYTSQASFNATNGTEYLVAVDGFSAASDNIVLSWNLDTKTLPFPIITNQPLSLVVTQSQTASFSVAVSSLPPEVAAGPPTGAARLIDQPTSLGFVSVSVGTIDAQLFNNFGAATSLGEPLHCGVLGGASESFDFHAVDPWILVIDTIGSKID